MDIIYEIRRRNLVQKQTITEMVRKYAHFSTVHLADYVNRRQALSDVSVTARKMG